MTLYQKKRQVVEAYKWMPDHETLDKRVPIPVWMPAHDIADGILKIHLDPQILYVLPNEWILKEGARIWSVSAEYFEEMYEPLEK